MHVRIAVLSLLLCTILAHSRRSTAEDTPVRSARLSEGKTLAVWYAEHASQLQGTATNREMNRVVAAALLPLFEQCPEHWEAVTSLNDGSPQTPQSFRKFVADWCYTARGSVCLPRLTPSRRRRRLLRLDFRLPAPSAGR